MQALIDFVAAKVYPAGGVRDDIVSTLVEQWPMITDSVAPDARRIVRRHLKKKYGSVIAIFLLSLLGNLIIKLVLEWWFRDSANRTMMREWSHAAKNQTV